MVGGFNTGCGKEVGGLILGVGKRLVVLIPDVGKWLVVLILGVGKRLVDWYWVSERGWWFGSGCRKEVGGLIHVGKRLVV